MKIDFVSQEGKEGFEIVRFYKFGESDLRELINGIDALLNDSADFYQLKSTKCFSFQICEKDIGVVLDSSFETSDIYCFLTKDSYVEIKEKVRKYIENEMEGIIWLYDLNCPIELLMSNGGEW